MCVGNIYTYFTSKDEIFSEVLLRGQTMYGRTIAQIADLDIDPREKLFEIAKGWLSNLKVVNKALKWESEHETEAIDRYAAERNVPASGISGTFERSRMINAPVNEDIVE